MAEIQHPEGYYNMDSVRNSEEYLEILVMGVLADLQIVGVDCDLGELRANSHSYQGLVSYLETKGWKQKINMDDLVAHADQFYKDMQTYDQAAAFRKSAERAVEQGAMTQEELEAFMKKRPKELRQ